MEEGCNKKLLGAPGIATRSKDATTGAPGLTTRNKDATRSKRSKGCCRFLCGQYGERLATRVRVAHSEELTQVMSKVATNIQPQQNRKENM